jgi:surface carbohydrate biosynthesis protein
MTAPIALLGIELQHRELLPFLVLAHELEQRGYQVVFSTLPELNRDIHRLRPAVVVDNCSRRRDHYYPYFYDTRQVDFRIMNMVWEQIVDPSTRQWFQFVPGFADHFIDMRVAWGSGFADFMRDAGVPDEQMAVTGSPKQALIPLIRQHVQKTEIIEHLLGADWLGRNIITFATGFVTAFLPQHTLAAYRKTDKNVDIWVDWAKTYHELYCKLVVALAQKHPDKGFIIRPHPGKAVGYADAYQKAVADCPNVKVLQGGDFTWILLASDMVVATRSTTLVDAAIANIPAVNLKAEYHPFDWRVDTQTALDYFGTMLTDAQLLDSLPEILRRPSQPEAPTLAKRWVQQWINIEHGQTFQRLADAIDKVRQRPRVPLMPHPVFEWRWRRIRAKQKIVSQPIQPGALETLFMQRLQGK